MVSIYLISNLTLVELLSYVVTIIAGLIIIITFVYNYNFFRRETNVQKTIVPQLAVSQSTFGIAALGNVDIGGNFVLGSCLEESFEELDLPRESKVFKGREKDIDNLEAIFFRNGKKKVVIHGLPGFGKTELAVQFAKYCKDSKNIDKAFWINAELSENLKSLNKILKRVYKIYENKRCLFIFDNGVSRSSIRQHEPPEEVKNFYLLITSHLADWDDDIYKMSLGELETKASLEVFKVILDKRYEVDEEKIYTKMITFVNNVPLGLIVIAGHLRNKIDACTQGNFDYNHFFGEISKMLKTKSHHCKTYEKSIYAAMHVALDKIFLQEFTESEEIRELSSKLLGICSYLDPTCIYIDDIKEVMECSNKNTMDECMYLSKNFSFIEYNDGVIKIHRLCQRILKLYFVEKGKDYYRVCLSWALRKEYWYLHVETILIEADKKKETILDIYQQNVSENDYRHIEKLMKLLVMYGCCESCELIFHKISVEKRKQIVDNTKLLHVVSHSYYANVRVLKMLLEYGDLNVEDSLGRTPLHGASQKWHKDIVQMLLEKGANVNVQDREGKTPLHYACESLEENIDIVRILLEKGANVGIQDSKGTTPLHCASLQGNVDIVQILLEKEADVRVLDYEGQTPLHKATFEGHADIVRMLLEKGSHVDVPDSEGRTPLHWASNQKNVDILRMLLEKEVDVDVRSHVGKTPLHWASTQRNPDIVRMLLEKGADVQARGDDGQTPLDVAILFNRTEIINILQQLMH